MTPRRIGAALALVGAMMLFVGTFSMRWLKAPAPHDGGVGLTGIEMCRGDRCQTASWDELKRAPKDIGIFGWVGLLGGLGAAGLAATIGGLVASGNTAKARTPIKVLNVVLGVASFATVMFAMRVFGEMSKDVSIGYSGFLAVGGIIAAGAIVTKGVLPLTKAAP